MKPSTKEEDILSLRDVERGLYEIFKPLNIKHIVFVFKNFKSLTIDKNITFLMIELVKIFGSTLVSLKLPGGLFDWVIE